MFSPPSSKTIKAKGSLIGLEKPIVMGILNVTPDSFFEQSRHQNQPDIAQKARQMVADGAAIIDVGAYSTRPGALDISADEEMRRLHVALHAIKNELPDVAVSIDTFRSQVAKMTVEHFGVDIINDISGGQADDQMFATVAKLNVGYVLMHMTGTLQTMHQPYPFADVVKEVSLFLSQQLDKLAWAGVPDTIIDPGFGFGKTMAHNYELMARLEEFQLFPNPLLVGISRKSMIYKTLNTTPADALNGTTALNTIALQKGANILRVHDVKEAVECINLVETIKHATHDVPAV